MAKSFEYYFAQLRKTEEHRSKEAEVAIRKLYKELLQDTKHFLAEEYYELAEDGELTFDILLSKGQNARFLEEVEQRLNGLSPKVSQEIQQTVEEMYTMAYNGMVDAVIFTQTREELKASLAGLKGVSPETIKATVENPIAGLTLKDTLEKNRKNIIWDIKRQIGVGLTNGDRYDTMARRVAKSLDGDYKKAITIVRTEAGRVREAGHLASARNINETLKNGTTSMRLVKTWKTMKDGRVRDHHHTMDGVTVAMDEDFVLPGGVKTQAPKQSGVASEDINCRCFVKYELKEDKTTAPDKAAKVTPKKLEIGEPYKLEHSEKDRQSIETYSKWKKDIEKATGKPIGDKKVKEMLDAVSDYTGEDYLNICSASADFKGLWGTYSATMDVAQRKEAKAKMEAVEQFLSLAPKHKGTVYRGLGFEAGGDFDVGSWDKFSAQMVEGNIIKMDNMSSWSSKEHVARQFASEKSGFDETADTVAEVILRLKDSKSGVHIADLARADVQYQDEVLFSRDVQYRIKKITKTSKFDDDDVENIKMIVDLEEA